MKYQDIIRFLEQTIWTIRASQVKPWLWHFYSLLKVILLAVKQSGKDKLFIRASALTYNTALSTVPFLAILFAVARGFGLEPVLESYFRSEVGTEEADIMLGWINSYLSHAQNGVFVGAGFFVLIWALFMLISNIEMSFNDIWQVRTARSVYRRFTDYFSMFLLFPLLLVTYSGVSILMTSYVRELLGFELLAPFLQFILKAVPFCLICAIFLGLYIFIPNTRVKIKYALVPAMLTSIAFLCFQYLYVHTQIWFSSYNAIYGSFAAIPLFLLFMQVSWTICLFGVELCFASQNLPYYTYKTETENISRQAYDFCCAIVLSHICKAFYRGESAPTIAELSMKHWIPIRLTNRIVKDLLDIALIASITTQDKQEEQAFLPAIDVHQLTLGMLLERLDRKGSGNVGVKAEDYSLLKERLIEMRLPQKNSTEDFLLKDL